MRQSVRNRSPRHREPPGTPSRCPQRTRCPCARDPTQGHLSEHPHPRPARDRHGHDRTTRAPRPAVTQSSEVSKLLDLIKQENIQVVDVKFCDLPGTWQHFSIPAATLDEDMIREGLGFDGSSIRGFQAINESDMLLMPDVSTAFVDPVLEVPTLSLTCDIYDPITLEPYSRDPGSSRSRPRSTSRPPASPPHRTGGPKRSSSSSTRVRFDQNAHEGYYHIDAEEGIWNSGRNGGSAQPGPSAPAQGGVLPGPARGSAAGRPLQDHAGADRGGRAGGGPAPRGGHRRAGGDRHQVRHAGPDRRPA